MENFFSNLGRLKAIGFAFLLTLPFLLAALLGFEKPALIVAFFAYFPFHIWLTISLFLVVFSRYERQRYLGEGWSAFGAFFGRIISPYGLACLSFFYVLMGWGYLIGVIG